MEKSRVRLKKTELFSVYELNNNTESTRGKSKQTIKNTVTSAAPAKIIDAPAKIIALVNTEFRLKKTELFSVYELNTEQSINTAATSVTHAVPAVPPALPPPLPAPLRPASPPVSCASSTLPSPLSKPDPSTAKQVSPKINEQEKLSRILSFAKDGSTFQSKLCRKRLGKMVLQKITLKLGETNLTIIPGSMLSYFLSNTHYDLKTISKVRGDATSFEVLFINGTTEFFTPRPTPPRASSSDSITSKSFPRLSADESARLVAAVKGGVLTQQQASECAASAVPVAMALGRRETNAISLWRQFLMSRLLHLWGGSNGGTNNRVEVSLPDDNNGCWEIALVPGMKDDDGPPDSASEPDASAAAQSTGYVMVESPSSTAGSPSTTELAEVDKAIEETMQELRGLVGDADEGADEDVTKQMMADFEEMAEKKDFGGLMEGLMKQLMSKDIMYEPAKAICDKYPEWLVDNEGKIPKDDYASYENQYQVMQRICAVFETEPDNYDRLVQLMTQMQDLGQPPAEIIEEVAPGLQAEGIADTLPPGLASLFQDDSDSEGGKQCAIM